MSERLNAVVNAIRNAFILRAERAAAGIAHARGLIVSVVVVGAAGYAIVKHPPVQTVERGEIGVRANQLTGTFDRFREGSVWVLPGLHEMRRFSLRDQI